MTDLTDRDTKGRAVATSAARSSPGTKRKKSRLPLVSVGVLVVVLLLDFFLKDLIPDSSIRQLLMLAACNVLVALSLNVINGMAGQFSIGHAGFIGIGGYTSAVMASNLHAWLGGGDVTFGHSFIVVPLCLAASAGGGGRVWLLV